MALIPYSYYHHSPINTVHCTHQPRAPLSAVLVDPRCDSITTTNTHTRSLGCVFCTHTRRLGPALGDLLSYSRVGGSNGVLLVARNVCISINRAFLACDQSRCFFVSRADRYLSFSCSFPFSFPRLLACYSCPPFVIGAACVCSPSCFAALSRGLLSMTVNWDCRLWLLLVRATCD